MQSEAYSQLVRRGGHWAPIAAEDLMEEYESYPNVILINKLGLEEIVLYRSIWTNYRKLDYATPRAKQKT
eukprot:IDg16480t1